MWCIQFEISSSNASSYKKDIKVIVAVICWKASLPVCLMNQRSLQLLHAPWSSYSNHPDASSSSFWCNSLETVARGPQRGKTDRLNQKYRLQFAALWNLLGGMEETQGSKLLYFKQFGSGRGSAATATVGWHEKDRPTRTARAPLFLICTLILSELQHGQESCWHFSQLSGWMRATWHLSVFVGVCMGEFNTLLHLHRKVKVFFFFYLI